MVVANQFMACSAPELGRLLEGLTGVDQQPPSCCSVLLKELLTMQYLHAGADGDSGQHRRFLIAAEHGAHVV